MAAGNILGAGSFVLGHNKSDCGLRRDGQLSGVITLLSTGMGLPNMGVLTKTRATPLSPPAVECLGSTGCYVAGHRQNLVVLGYRFVQVVRSAVGKLTCYVSLGGDFEVRFPLHFCSCLLGHIGQSPKTLSMQARIC